MDPLLLSMIERFAQLGATRFSGWKPALFRDYCQTTIPRIWQDHGQAVATAGIQLLCEGIGNGYMASGLQDRPTNLMEHCLRDWLPARLPAVPPEQQLSLLASTWNLLEGLLGEPAWVNAYVMARANELDQDA